MAISAYIFKIVEMDPFLMLQMSAKEEFNRHQIFFQGRRLAKRILVAAPVTFMMTQQRTRTICNPKLIAIFSRLEKI